MSYKELNLRKAIENKDYNTYSKEAICKIDSIFNDLLNSANNEVAIKSNLSKGLPIENINKIAGPILEEWVCTVFESKKKQYDLLQVKPQKKTALSDVDLKFNIGKKEIKIKIDVKATCEEIKGSGKSPNITSFGKIRDAYLNNQNFIFLIFSIKYSVEKMSIGKDGFFTDKLLVKDFNIYDFKFIADNDLTYNPALGTGQIQIKDIHNVKIKQRNVDDLLRLLDTKYLNSSKRTFSDFRKLAVKNKWLDS